LANGSDPQRLLAEVMARGVLQFELARLRCMTSSSGSQAAEENHA
jgi:hypothetical protein